MANSQKWLQQLMDNMNKVTREFTMKINVKKTKVMCISHKGNNKLKIYVDGQQNNKIIIRQFVRRHNMSVKSL